MGTNHISEPHIVKPPSSESESPACRLLLVSVHCKALDLELLRSSVPSSSSCPLVEIDSHEVPAFLHWQVHWHFLQIVSFTQVIVEPMLVPVPWVISDPSISLIWSSYNFIQCSPVSIASRDRRIWICWIVHNEVLLVLELKTESSAVFVPVNWIRVVLKPLSAPESLPTF